MTCGDGADPADPIENRASASLRPATLAVQPCPLRFASLPCATLSSVTGAGLRGGAAESLCSAVQE